MGSNRPWSDQTGRELSRENWSRRRVLRRNRPETRLASHRPRGAPGHVQRDLARRASGHAPRPMEVFLRPSSPSNCHSFLIPISLLHSLACFRVSVINSSASCLSSTLQTLSTMSSQVTPSKQVRDVTSRLSRSTRRRARPS